MSKSPSEFDPKLAFHGFMLSQLEMYGKNYLHLLDFQREAERFYLTAVSAIIGGVILLFTSQTFTSQTYFHAILILALAFLLIGLIGTQRSWHDWHIWEIELSYHAEVAGLHRYFKQFDPVAFERFGRQSALDGIESPYYWMAFGRAPWKKIRLVGWFATFHILLVSVGLGMLSGTISDWMFATGLRVNLTIPLLVTVITFTVCLYWMAHEVEKRHLRARRFHEQKLEIYSSPAQEPTPPNTRPPTTPQGKG